MKISAMQKNVEQMFFVLQIMAFECGAVTYLYYEVNSCDRQSTCYQTVLRSQMLLVVMFSDWKFFPDQCKIRIKVPLCRIYQSFGVVNTLIPERYSETGAFWHSSNHIFRNQ